MGLLRVNEFDVVQSQWREAEPTTETNNAKPLVSADADADAVEPDSGVWVTSGYGRCERSWMSV